MAQKSFCKLYFNIYSVIITLLFANGCQSYENNRVYVCQKYNSEHVDSISYIDTTYHIFDRASKRMVYNGGHNIISLYTIIGDNYIFSEDIITEECSERIIIYNTTTAKILRAYNFGWLYNFSDEEIERISTRQCQPYRIELIGLDSLRLDFINDSTTTLELKADYNL